MFVTRVQCLGGIRQDLVNFGVWGKISGLGGLFCDFPVWCLVLFSSCAGWNLSISLVPSSVNLGFDVTG